MPGMQNLLWLEIGCLLGMTICALGYRFHFISFKPAFVGFLLLGLVLWVCAVLALISMFKTPSLAKLPLVVLGLLPIVAFALIIGSSGLKVPKIHDVSTRFEPPIHFELANKVRDHTHNSIRPASEKTVAMQKSYYPDIAPLVVDSQIESCFELLEKSIETLGWGVHGKNLNGKDLNATDSNMAWLEVYERSALFGFTDDVRIELTALSENRCQIDVRSVSRVGLSDLGANAKRIQRLFDSIKP